LTSIPFGRTVLKISEKKRPRRISGQEESNREMEERTKEELQMCMQLDVSELLNQLGEACSRRYEKKQSIFIGKR
jgi:hypothetical protein